MSLLGAIGYAPRGPLWADEDPDLADVDLVISSLKREATSLRLPYVVVQPHRNNYGLEPRLVAAGFGRSTTEAATTATSRIGLAQSLERIMGRMHRGTRRNIRRGLRQRVIVREGTEQDLALFHRLHAAASKRRRLRPYPVQSLFRLWEDFAPRGYARLFIAEYGGEPVSGHLTIPFGDTVVSYKSGWSGRCGPQKPNETLEWAVIRWAKAQGYRYYDLDGIDPLAVAYIQNGEGLPDSLKQTWTSYKLGFGGDVVLFPRAYGYSPSPILRWTDRAVVPRARKFLLARFPVSLARLGRGKQLQVAPAVWGRNVDNFVGKDVENSGVSVDRP